MTPHVVLFTQPGCLSCELMRVFLEAKGVAFEERDISSDPGARSAMLDLHDSNETPTLVVIADGVEEVVVGFDPLRLDELLEDASSSDSVSES